MLRRATEDDLPRLVELWMEMMHDHHAFEPRMVLTKFADSAYQSYLLLHMRSAKSLVVLDEQEEGIVAFCCAYICQNLPMFEPSEFGYISDLVVTASWQSKGIGTTLLKYVKELVQKVQYELPPFTGILKEPEGKALLGRPRVRVFCREAMARPVMKKNTLKVNSNRYFAQYDSSRQSSVLQAAFHCIG